VRDRLSGQGFDGVFLDFHPDDGIPAGANWEAELYAQLKRCVAVVYLGSRASAESRWCFAELALARSLGKPIFPLRIEAGAKQPLITDLQWTDVTADGERAYERLWRGMSTRGIDPEAAFAWRADRAPYPGLDAFQEPDAAVFFGRREESQALFERVANSLLQSHERFVAVIGPSGSGKSSLVRAGLIPRLRREGAPWLIAPPFVPQDNPLEMLSRSLSQTFTALGRDHPWRDVAAEVTAPGGLKAVARDLLDLTGDEHRVLILFVDQGEELVTLSSAAAREEFTGLVSEALTGASVLRVVATLRSEFLTGALQETRLASLLAEPFLLGPLPRSRLSSVVAGPAEIAGIELAPGLVERIVEDTGGGDALPLMAFTMRRLYQRLHEERQPARPVRIEEADYVAVGGVDGALRQRASEVRAELDRAGLDATVMPTLLKLVALEQEAAPTRRRVRLAELSADEHAVLQAFIDARLVATDRAGDDGVAYVAHEALLRVWQPLADAVAADVDGLRERSRLERDAREWEESGRDEGYLLRGERLEDALAKLGPTGDERSLLTAFLDASQALRDRALAREADLLANRIIGEYDDDPERAMLVARAAIEAYGPRPRLQLALSYAVNAPGRRLRIQRESLGSLAVSPDGGMVAVGGYPEALMVANAVTGVLWERRDEGPQSFDSPSVADLAFARRGEFLAVTWRDRSSIDVFASESGDLVATLDLGEAATALAASEDLIVAGGSGGRVRIWRAEPPFALRRELVAVAAVSALDISEWQNVIAVGAGRFGFVLELGYDFLRGGDDVEPTASERASTSEEIRIVRLSPDGHRMLIVGKDAQTIAVWSVSGEREGRAPLEIDIGENIGEALWHGDGSRIVTANWRAGLQAWDARTGAALGRAVAGDPGSNLAAGSRDGTRIATLDRDGVLSLWDVRGPGPRLRVRLGDAFQTARLACDDRVLVSRGRGFGLDELLKAHDARTGRELKSIKATLAVSAGIAISPDGKTAATLDDAGVVCYTLPELEDVRHVPAGSCNHVIFDPRRPGDLITADDDGVIARWTGTRSQIIARVGEFYVGSLDIAPDGSSILVAKSKFLGDGFVSLLDALTGEPRFERRMEKTSGGLLACIAPDGSCIAIGQGDSLRTVALDGTDLVEFAWGSYNIGSAWAAQVDRLAFAPDGRRLATATAEGWVYLWDVASGELVTLLPVDNEPLKDIAFSRDGNEIVVCTAKFTGEYDSEGHAEIWPCPSLEQLLEMTQNRTFRDITGEELAAYGLSDEYGARSAASMFHLARWRR
jgi:WD40 repeat protein